MTRMIFFLTVFALVCFAVILYMISGAIGWAESIQILLLNIIIYSGLLFALSVLLDIAVNAGVSIMKHKKYLLGRAFVLLLLGIAAFIFSTSAIVISVLVKGNIA
jgi:hypothetical protein